MLRAHGREQPQLPAQSEDLCRDVRTTGRIAQELDEFFFSTVRPEHAGFYRHPGHTHTAPLRRWASRACGRAGVLPMNCVEGATIARSRITCKMRRPMTYIVASVSRPQQTLQK